MKADESSQLVTGSEALAYGALEAGVQLVTGYPGSPITATVEAFSRLVDDPQRVFWAINEKSAVDLALGISLAGGRALLCVKSPGLNVALDSLMVANLAPGDGGFVILAGDDPGGWGSQNEEDSRPLIQALEIPMLEPSSVSQAFEMMHSAFELSEEFCLPVVVRVIHAITVDRATLQGIQPRPLAYKPRPFTRQRDRWTVLPIQVVSLHTRLQEKLNRVQHSFESSPFNIEEGFGRRGVIAAGYSYQKLKKILLLHCGVPLKVLQLDTIHPLPDLRIGEFLRGLDEVLIIEETAPLIETEVKAIAQTTNLTLQIYGRESGHIPGTGELDAESIAAGLIKLVPEWNWQIVKTGPRSMISRKALCDGCPYIPVYDALLKIMEKYGGRDRYVVTGETGCLVRGQLPPWEMLDVKYSMGSSIGIASGMQRAGIPQRLIVLSGDSAFLHNGFGELVDAVRTRRDLLIIILDNNTTALTGGQPHPATRNENRIDIITPVDLVDLVKAAGVDRVRVVDPLDETQLYTVLEEGMRATGVRVVISRSPCILYPANSDS